MKASLTKRMAIDQSILKWEYIKTHIKDFQLRYDLEHFEFPDNAEYIHNCPMCTYATERFKSMADCESPCHCCPLTIFWTKTCDKRFGKALYFYWKRSSVEIRVLICETILDALYAMRKGKIKDHRNSSLIPFPEINK